MRSVDEHTGEYQQGVAAPWVTRTAAAGLLGVPVAIAPEDRAAVEAEAVALLHEAARRVRR